MLDNLNLDHVAINVKESMDESYQLFSELGFTLTPRGYHSLGSINHSMVFKNDYLELIGTPKGKPITRVELKKAEIGINGLVFRSRLQKTLLCEEARNIHGSFCHVRHGLNHLVSIIPISIIIFGIQ